MIKLMLVIACLGHVICGITDCMMAYTKDGRFEFSDTKDNGKMKRIFSSMPLKQIELAMIVGVAALFLSGGSHANLPAEQVLGGRPGRVLQRQVPRLGDRRVAHLPGKFRVRVPFARVRERVRGTRRERLRGSLRSVGREFVHGFTSLSKFRMNLYA